LSLKQPLAALCDEVRFGLKDETALAVLALVADDAR